MKCDQHKHGTFYHGHLMGNAIERLSHFIYHSRCTGGICLILVLFGSSQHHRHRKAEVQLPELIQSSDVPASQGACGTGTDEGHRGLNNIICPATSI